MASTSTTVALLALLALATAHQASAARMQNIPTATVQGTNILKTDVTSRTSTAGLKDQIQGGVRQGSTADPVGSLARTRQANNVDAGTRAAIGGNAAQAAVQAAVRTGNAAAATSAGAGIAQATNLGTGLTVNSAGTRSSVASQSASSAVQQAAAGRTSASTATGSGQTTARASQIATSHQAGRR